jgi:hypothetical protein
MKRLCTAMSLLGVLTCLPSFAQTACPKASEIHADMLIGAWEVELHTQPPQRWPLTLQAHQEHTGSLQGRLLQGARTAQVVADWDEGEFTMEESHDGQRIAATWLGTATEGQCGRQIAGTRQQDDAAGTTRFTMRAGTSLPERR